MVSAKKSLLKRILITIISILLIFSLISMVATKIIYDSVFSRTDNTVIVPAALEQIVNDRTLVNYPCGDNILSGYLYKSGKDGTNNTLLILAPGFNAGADSYLPQIRAFLDMGYSVFAFDPTGSFASQGKSAVGFSQEIFDLEATLEYVESENRFGYNSIVLFGHSRGGYAACCAARGEYDISAVISVSGINSAMEAIMGSSVSYAGNIAYLNYGFLWLYQAMLFGADTVNLSVDDVINESDVPVLIIHGEQDAQVPMNRFSIISHRDDIEGDNVHYYICSDKSSNGHTNLLFDEDGTANDKLFAHINSFLVNSVLN